RAHGPPALAPDLDVVVDAVPVTDRAAALLADRGEELGTALLRDRLAALAADLGVELGAVSLLDHTTAAAPRLLDGHLTIALGHHFHNLHQLCAVRITGHHQTCRRIDSSAVPHLAACRMYHSVLPAW